MSDKIQQQKDVQKKSVQAIDNSPSNKMNDLGIIKEYIPFSLGGWSEEELKQGKAFQPNWYQKYMPELFGGWSSEKLENYQKAAEAAGYVNRPNWVGRHFPTWLGGASDEEIKKYNDFAKKYQFVPRPNIWEKYAPTWLGGVSKEEIKAYDDYLEKFPKELGIWDKYAPAWLGGMSKEELKKHKKTQEDTTTVFKGVTVGKLREAGFTEEKIQTMQNMIHNERTEQVAVEAQNNPLGLKNRFGICAQPLTLEVSDYIKAGISKEEMATIYQISQNSIA